jgi:meso-butanediol dehydrogenase / (S,S)-butanediol dehydrogenase / diacetyl reductase
VRELEGKVALVTGAGQGIGRGIALALADAGAAVAVVGRTKAKLDAVASEIAHHDGRALAVGCDVADPDAIRSTVDAVVAEFGSVDVLANVAHHAVRRGRLLEMDDDDVERNWATGPLAALRFMRACHEHLRGDGVVLNTGSGAQFRPEGYGVYAAAKDAIAAITRAAAVEWGPDGIRAHLLVPHALTPAMETDLADPERRAASLTRIPLGRFGTPEEIGRVAVFLAGPSAAYMTGQVLLVDGGMSYHR